MEHEDYAEDTNVAKEEQAAYEAHQDYGPDGNYDDSYYAMSASTQYNYSGGYPNEEDNEETYAS